MITPRLAGFLLTPHAQKVSKMDDIECGKHGVIPNQLKTLSHTDHAIEHEAKR
jgi:hypothetical protein